MKKLLALFMSWLIILLPVSTAAIYGLNNGVVQGQDNVPGYVRNSQDLFSFWVNANLPNDPEITPNQVRLSNRTQFGTCEADLAHPDFGWRCWLTSQDFHTLDVCDSADFQVALYDDRGTQTRYRADIRSVCDHLPPEITASTDKQLYNAEDTIRITAQILEKASTESSVQPNESVGLRSVTVNGVEHVLDRPQGRRILQESFTLAASDLQDGPNTLQLTATDYFDQASTTAVSFRVDKTPPALTLHELQIKENNIPVVFFSSILTDVQFSISITESDLNQSSVSANLALFDRGNQQATCQPPVEGVTLCSWEFPYTLASANFDFDIPITVSDNAGNTVTQQLSLSRQFTEDTQGPFISNLVISRNGQPLTGWTRSDIGSVDVSVRITEQETGLNLSSLGADLHELNSNLVTPSSPGSNPCRSPEAGSWECTWRAVPVVLDRTGEFQINIPFTATDRAAQPTTTHLSAMLKIDEESPEVTSLVSNHLAEGASWLARQNNILTATFTENNAMDPQKVFLDLSPIEGQPRVAATSCNNAANAAQITCTWEHVGTILESGTATLSFTSDSTDALGNVLLPPPTPFSFSIDGKPPEVANLRLRPVGTSQNPIERGITITYNALEITANVTDTSVVTATTDFSSLQTGATSKQAECSPVQGGSRCVWNQNMVITRLGPFTTDLTLIFTDFVGNEVRRTEPVQVVGLGGETPVDYWDLVVGEPSPHGIDRSLVTFYDPFIWFPITLAPKEPNVYPVDIQIGECSGQNNLLSSEKNNKPEIIDFNSVRERQAPYQFYLKYTMEKSAPESPAIPVTCNINIRTLVNDEVISTAESQQVAVEISYYNNPFGSVDENIDAEIDKAKDSWRVKATWLDIANTILAFAKTVCLFLYRWKQIQAVWAGITDAFKGCCQTLGGIGAGPSCCAAATAQGASLEAGKETFNKLYEESGNKWCKLLSCQMWAKDWLGVGADPPYGNLQPTATEGVPRTIDSSKSTAGSTWYQRIIDSPWFLQNRAYSREGYFGNVDPQGSLILSIAFLCLPGVIYNLQKARVIDCEYIGCLKLAKQGLPVSLCSERRSYQYCKFVWGEIFNLIPFASAISVIAQNLLRALSHPLALVGFAGKLYCKTQCTQPTSRNPCTGCTIFQFVEVFSEIACDLGLGGCTAVWENLQIGGGACDKALEDEE